MPERKTKDYTYRLVIQEGEAPNITDQHVTMGEFRAKDMDNARGKIAYAIRASLNDERERRERK